MTKNTLTALGLVLALTPASALHATAADRPQAVFQQQIGVAAAPSPAAQRQAVFDLPAIEAALHAAGMPFDKRVAPSGNVLYGMQIAGVKFVVIAYRVDGNSARSLELRAGFSDGGKMAAGQKIADCNKWNMNRRFVKAYVDGDNVMLEMDLVAVGAVEPQEVVRTISGPWMFSVMQFTSRAI